MDIGYCKPHSDEEADKETKMVKSRSEKTRDYPAKRMI